MSDINYNDKAAEYFENERREMLPFVPQGANLILEIGCGNASFAAYLKSQRQVHITAIEAYPEAAVLARSRVDRFFGESIENALPQLIDQSFDCIIMNDVLEHLVDPWSILASVKTLLTPQGSIVASIPNVRYMPVFKEFVMQGRWQYKKSGVLDRTHLRFFTESSMRDLFETSGYLIDRMEGIRGIKFPWKFALLNALTRNALADTRYMQFACVVRKR